MTTETVDFNGVKIPKAAYERAQQKAAWDRHLRWQRHLRTSTNLQSWVKLDIKSAQMTRVKFFLWMQRVKGIMQEMPADRLMSHG